MQQVYIYLNYKNVMFSIFPHAFTVALFVQWPHCLWCYREECKRSHRTDVSFDDDCKYISFN